MHIAIGLGLGHQRRLIGGIIGVDTYQQAAWRLVWSLGDLPHTDPEMIELYGSLDAARAEVQALRVKRVATTPPGLQPFWMKSPAPRRENSGEA